MEGLEHHAPSSCAPWHATLFGNALLFCAVKPLYVFFEGTLESLQKERRHCGGDTRASVYDP